MNKLLLGVLLLAGGTALHSCSDEWDEHYSDSGSNALNATGASVWSRLTSMPEYSAFVDTLKNHNYDRILSQNRAFTVYAPTNTAMQSYVANGRYNVMDAFVRNHIAYFSHPISAYTDTTVEMMNEKVMRVRNQLIGTNQEQNISFVEGETNVPCRNGLIHGINGIIPYIPNLWEIIAVEAPAYSAYVHQQDEQVLNTDESTVDSINTSGQTVYLDSVVTYNNGFWNTVGQLNTEDSSYVSIVLADDGWQNAYDKVEQSFLYYPQAQGQYFWQENTDQSNLDSLSRYKDAMIYQTILRSLTYRLPQVELLLDDNYRPGYDFINSVSGRRIPKEVLKNYLERIPDDSIQEASNGRAYIAHGYDFANYDVIQDTITTEGENSTRLFTLGSTSMTSSAPTLNTDTLSYTHYQPETPINNVEYYVPQLEANGQEEKHEVSGSSYLTVSSTTNGASVTMGVSGTYSGQYDVWITFIPSSSVVGFDLARPSTVTVRTQYTTVRNESTLSFGTINASNIHLDPYAVTKVKVGTIDLGACWNGFLGMTENLYEDEDNITSTDLFNEKYGVKITIRNTASVSATDVDKNLYIDCIELVPHRDE